MPHPTPPRRFLTRRRFLALSAVAAWPVSARAAPHITQWHGVALGAEAAIYLDHPDADAIIARAVAEITRLESVFSLYRADSALTQLNRTGRLDAPSFDLLECLSLAARVHAATGGLFDPSVQPLWQLYATRFSAGQSPSGDEIAALLPRVGLGQVQFDSTAVVLPPGAALTLNGIAQGFIADKVAALLADEGLTDILINTGEYRALGQMPDGNAWPVRLASGGRVDLTNRALATSAPLGTVFDIAGRVGHILDPHSGLPAASQWRSVTISAPQAAVADALSTAACLLPNRAAIQAALSAFPASRLEALV